MKKYLCCFFSLELKKRKTEKSSKHKLTLIIIKVI